jgi:hypothetical protein
MFSKSKYILVLDVLWSTWLLFSYTIGSFSLAVGIPNFLYHYLLSHSIYVEALLCKRCCCKSMFLQAILLARTGGMLLGHPKASSYAQSMGSTLYICIRGMNSCPNFWNFIYFYSSDELAQNSLCSLISFKYVSLL